MDLAFDEVKATQTAAVLLNLAGGSLNYMGLIKLLYRVDREALRRWGLPVTTDKYVSMAKGPVTSHIYNLIKASATENSHPTFWSSWIKKDSNPRNVYLVADPGKSELSRAEEQLLAEIFAADGSKDRFELVDECHRDFPEWKDPGSSSSPIEIADIIVALGLTEIEAERVKSLIDTQRAAFTLAL